MTTRIPRYLLIYNSLKRRIENLEYPVGDFLPPEPELEKLFHVSRTTIRKAVEMLANEGFVNIRQGKGTRVLDFKATQKLQYVTSFSETLKEQGFKVAHSILSVKTLHPPVQVAEQLAIPENDYVVEISRLTRANGKPIAVIRNYLLPHMVQGIEEKIETMQSLYQFLEREYHIFIDAATDFISAAVADGDLTKLLETDPGEPLLVVRRISFRQGEPIELAELRIIAERYEYSVYTKQRPPGDLSRI